MTKPLALVYYERLLPGSQLANRLQDLGYRVQVVEDAARLIDLARQEKPIVLLADLVTEKINIFTVIKDLKHHSETNHVPVIGFAGQKHKKQHKDAVDAGANLVAFDDGIIPQLPQLLDHALHID